MSRHATFGFCLDPTVEQERVLARHAGAARFAFNQCLRLHLTARKDAGRRFTVDSSGGATVVVTGLGWRGEVSQQVFEEAAVDLGKALKAWTESRKGKRQGRKVGHPRFKKKSHERGSFRLRNKHPKNGRPAIRVGERTARTVTLPGIGTVKVLFATITRRAGRWWISLNVEAADLHPAHHHTARSEGDHGGWVGIDRGLSAPVVAARADGTEVARVPEPPRALARGMARQRRLARALTRKTTTVSATSGTTSCTRSATSWSRPTTGSSSKTSMCRECSPTTASPVPSPMPAGPSSPAC